MEKEKINISSENLDRITQDLLRRGLTEYQINRITYGEYQTFSDENEFEEEADFLDIIQILSDGYTMEDLESKGISSWKIHKFEKFLLREKLNKEQVVALNRYSAGSDMIWFSKKNASKRAVYDQICDDFSQRFAEYGFSSAEIADIQYQVKFLDYMKPLHENYDQIKEKLASHDFSEQSVKVVQDFVMNLNSFYHLDETVEALESSLKSNIENSIKVYRALKLESLKQYAQNITELKGKRMKENNFVSTSPIYDLSYAKYDDYDVVMEMYVPKGTQGRNITDFSNYGNVEQEIVLNGCDLYVFDVEPNVIDKNGRNKTFLKMLTLSRDKEVYKYVDENENSKSDQLPKKQNKLIAFFAKLMAKFSGKKFQSEPGSYKPETEENPEPATNNTNPWAVSEEEINRNLLNPVSKRVEEDREQEHTNL